MMKKRILVLGAFLALLATLLSSCGAYAPKGEIAGPDGAEDQMNFAPAAPAEEVEAKPEASEAAGDDEGPRKILENSFQPFPPMWTPLLIPCSGAWCRRDILLKN